jgi:hypothetical protein
MWVIDLKLSRGDGDEGFELSVVQHDAEMRRSWGWGGPEKIILFGTSIGQNQLTIDRLPFALGLAERLAKSLNDVPVPENSTKSL